MSTNSNNQHLLNYHDALIYPSDIALLDSPTEWLNDACINYHMTRLQHTQDERRKTADEGEVEPEHKRQKLEGIVELEDLFLDP